MQLNFVADRFGKFRAMRMLKQCANDPLSVSFETAAENHLRDALRMTHTQRWQWLAGAMDFGFEIVKSRASKGLHTVGPNGEVIPMDAIEAFQTDSAP